MRMIPPTVAPNGPSAAEEKVFRLLEATDWGKDAVAYHSLNLSSHEYKRVGELDFVVVHPGTLLVLEVKGGGVSCRDGVWTYVDRYRVEHRSSEGPFKQGSTGMFGLERLVKDRLGPGAGRLTYGHAVLFPDCRFDVSSVEWDEAIVLDRPSIGPAKEIRAWLRGVEEYWQGKVRAPRIQTEDEYEALLRLLRPDFDRVPSLAFRAEELDVETDKLTSEQYRCLDLLEKNDRIVFAGGAGTGKTFLALEAARREAARGRSTLLVTRSRALSGFLKSRSRTEGVTVVPVEELPDRRFERLIVDEGQDLLSAHWLAELDARLIGGLNAGCWRWFYDQNNQSGFYGDEDPDALALLLQAPHTDGTLTLNCRNTTEIVTQTRLVTGADLGLPTVGTGPGVEYRVLSAPSEEAVAVAERLDELERDGVAPGHITILSLHVDDFRESVAARLPRRWKEAVVRLTPDDIGSAPSKRITWAAVGDFKGLENRHILVADITRINQSHADVARWYVAMSRPRVSLWIALPRSLEADFGKMCSSHLAAMGGRTDG